MIEVIPFEQSSVLKGHLENFIPKSETWIVSDLHTKIQVQNFLIEKYGYFREDSVLRASDFWKLIFRKVHPEIRVVNDQLLKVLIRDILKNRPELFPGISTQSERTLLAYLNHFAGIIFHPTGFEQLRNWLKESPNSAQNWEHWLIASKIFLFLLLDEKKVISPRWIPGLLQRSLNLQNFWNRPLIFDLGCHLSYSEAELIKNLSSSLDIKLLKPNFPWVLDYHYLLKSYELFSMGSSKEAQAQSRQKNLLFEQCQRVSVKRVASQLAEVKLAVSQCRDWLQQGISPKDILICAPDIESYWPVLKHHFELEGIPVHKSTVAKLQEVPSVSHWLSTLRVRSRQLKTGDLESAIFHKEDDLFSFEKFRALFGKIYGPEDLERHHKVAALFPDHLENKKNWSAQEFLNFALRDWSSRNYESLEIILKEVLGNASGSFQLSFDEWIFYLENIVAQKELNLQEPTAHGVECLKIQAALQFENQYRVCLGLCEEQFKLQQVTQLSQDDIFRISKDLGFNIENPEISHLEFDLRMLLQVPAKHQVLTFPESDFNGTLLNPAKIWLQAESERSLDKDLKLITRADELISSFDSNLESIKIKKDLGLAQQEPIQHQMKRTISPSRLDDYHKCQFIFAAKNLYRLEDEPLVDLDLDHRTRGVFAHGLFEKLLTKPLRQDWKREEIEDILESIVARNQIVFADPRIWQALKSKQVQIAYRFLRFEKERQDSIQSQGFQTFKEHDIEIYFNPQTFQFLPEPNPEVWTLRCRIDRIDIDGNKAVIFDYKSSPSSAPSLNKWTEDKKFQLLFYSWAFENSTQNRSEVVGFFYYIFKNFKTTGFGLENENGQLFIQTPKSVKGHTQDYKAQLFSNFQTSLQSALASIEAGFFEAKPLDVKECDQCKWKVLCRAPHLL